MSKIKKNQWKKQMIIGLPTKVHKTCSLLLFDPKIWKIIETQVWGQEMLEHVKIGRTRLNMMKNRLKTPKKCGVAQERLQTWILTISQNS